MNNYQKKQLCFGSTLFCWAKISDKLAKHKDDWIDVYMLIIQLWSTSLACFSDPLGYGKTVFLNVQMFSQLYQLEKFSFISPTVHQDRYDFW